jgi:hypothetical protein
MAFNPLEQKGIPVDDQLRSSTWSLTTSKRSRPLDGTANYGVTRPSPAPPPGRGRSGRALTGADTPRLEWCRFRWC